LVLIENKTLKVVDFLQNKVLLEMEMDSA